MGNEIESKSFGQIAYEKKHSPLYSWTNEDWYIQREYEEMAKAVITEYERRKSTADSLLAEKDKPCPYVITSNEGTNYCTLAVETSKIIENLIKERDEARQQIISVFYGDESPYYTQGFPVNELQEICTAEQVNGLVKVISQLREALK